MTHTHTHTHRHAQTRTDTHRHAHTDTNTHTDTHTHTHTNTHRHAHTHGRSAVVFENPKAELVNVQVHIRIVTNKQTTPTPDTRCQQLHALASWRSATPRTSLACTAAR